MSDLDAKTWIDAAESYRRLRRLYWRFGLGSFASFGVFIVSFVAASEASANPSLPTLIFFLFLPIFFGCGLGGLVTIFALGAFRCPRCENSFWEPKWFGGNSLNRWPGNLCNHCRLDIRSVARVDEKSPKVADPLE